MSDDIQTQEPVTEEQDSLLSMSDEEYLKLDLPLDGEEVEEVTDQTTDDSQEDEVEVTDEDDDTDEEIDETLTESTDEEEGTDETEHSEGEETEADQETEKDSGEVDYKSFYEQITAPFRANNKEMRIENVEDALQLMKMGAGFNKKMAALKPHLRTIKLLENNNLLEEEKLSYLIDLDKKNPDAIQKLLKESGIDPLDIDTQKESDYKPNTYKVDERELALDEAIRDISDTPTFTKTAELVTKTWDEASKNVVVDQPELIKVINDHMANGIYDVINSKIEQERMLGRLTGLSDIEAYRQVGDAIQAQGGFDHLFQAKEQSQATVVRTEPNPSKANKDPQLKAKKRAASSTKPTKSKSQATEDFNPLGMSDEEFEKVGLTKFL